MTGEIVAGAGRKGWVEAVGPDICPHFMDDGFFAHLRPSVDIRLWMTMGIARVRESPAAFVVAWRDVSLDFMLYEIVFGVVPTCLPWARISCCPHLFRVGCSAFFGIRPDLSGETRFLGGIVGHPGRIGREFTIPGKNERRRFDQKYI